MTDHARMGMPQDVALDYAKNSGDMYYLREEGYRATMRGMCVMGLLLILMQFALLAGFLFVVWDLHREESTILSNTMDVLKKEVYPDVLRITQHKMEAHVGCVAYTLEASLECTCTALAGHFGFPVALCNGLSPCSVGGVDGIIDTCDLDHILDFDSSEIVSYFESPAP